MHLHIIFIRSRMPFGKAGHASLPAKLYELIQASDHLRTHLPLAIYLLKTTAFGRSPLLGYIEQGISQWHMGNFHPQQDVGLSANSLHCLLKKSFITLHQLITQKTFLAIIFRVHKNPQLFAGSLRFIMYDIYILAYIRSCLPVVMLQEIIHLRLHVTIRIPKQAGDQILAQFVKLTTYFTIALLEMRIGTVLYKNWILGCKTRKFGNGLTRFRNCTT